MWSLASMELRRGNGDRRRRGELELWRRDGGVASKFMVMNCGGSLRRTNADPGPHNLSFCSVVVAAAADNRHWRRRKLHFVFVVRAWNDRKSLQGMRLQFIVGRGKRIVGDKMKLFCRPVASQRPSFFDPLAIGVGQNRTAFCFNLSERTDRR